jgi:copper(I)-binding protein
MPDHSSAGLAAAGVLGLSIAATLALAQPPAIEVSNAWARATVPLQTTAGAYLDIRSRDAARLVGAVSPQADMTEIHHTVHEGGVVKMSPVGAIELPAGRTVRLAPGGYHIMLMGLRRQLKQGESMPLRLQIEDTQGSVREIEVRVEVRAPAARGARPSHHH